MRTALMKCRFAKLMTKQKDSYKRNHRGEKQMHIHMLENRVFDLESQVRALEYRLHEVEKVLMNLINISVDYGD